VNDLLVKIRNGSFRAIARAITQIENSDDAAMAIVSKLYKDGGHAHIIGITGPPGAGKSTLVNELAQLFAANGEMVAIVAVDPSSPFSGGALLGDRVRMLDLSNHPRVFIRSMASRGNLGGLASATAAVVHVFDAAHFDSILVETVGAGQAEVDIANNAHSTLVIEAPGMGDDVQSIKAGILEIADILVVNKADRRGAMRTAKSLEMMVDMGQAIGFGHHMPLALRKEMGETLASQTWRTPVLQTVANKGEGIKELYDVIGSHRRYLESSGEWRAREENRSRREMERLLQERFFASFQDVVPEAVRTDLVKAVVRRELDPYGAVNHLFERYKR
jgi:LAO/AO transport system kinase